MVEPQEGKGKENEKEELTEEELMRTIKQILASQERQAKSQETVQQTPQTVEVFGFSCDADTSKGVLVGAVAFLCACLLPSAAVCCGACCFRLLPCVAPAACVT